MSSIYDAIQTKCLPFSDRIIKLNNFLLKEAANKKPSFKMINGKQVYDKAIPVYLQSVSALCNQFLRSGTNIGANYAEATNAKLLKNLENRFTGLTSSIGINN